MAMTSLPKKHLFELPDGVIYLDGNSLGPLPKSVNARLSTVIRDEWGGDLIRGWNSAGWMAQPSRVGDKIARLIGAPDASVAVGDTLSVKVFQALASALSLRPKRRVILTETHNFPSDIYMANGLIRLKDAGYELRTVAPSDVKAALNETVAVVMLTEVDYRTGQLYDMSDITGAAHAVGAVALWDLAHSVGAIEVDMAASGAEFAVGCTYKYLNAGPGAPAFIYVRPDLVHDIEPALAGWLGHADPFAFEQDYRPAEGVERMRIGTPPVLQMAALEEALALWEDVDMTAIRAASIRLSERFVAEVEARCPDVKLASPRDPMQRGSHISFAYEHGYAAMQALIAHGVIGDFRPPNLMRFGFAPLYLSEDDIVCAAETLERVVADRLWDTPEFLRVNRVT